jgi:hypothetical protein
VYRAALVSLPRRPLLALAALAAVLLVVSAASGAAAPAPILTITQVTAGLNDSSSGGYEPPDVGLAAGSGFVMELVNLAARTWRTGSGAPQQMATQALNDFFHAGTDRLTDPRILYDAQSSRWFASISDIDTNSVLLAVSRGGDPSSGWSLYSYVASGCPDQPRIGLADGVLVIAADVFRSCDEGLSPAFGGELWIVNKQQLVAAAASPAFTTYGPDRAYESFAPVQSMSSTATEYVVAVDNPSSRVVHLLSVDGIPPAAVRVQEASSIPISPLTQPPPAQQPPAGGQRQPSIETNDDRVLDSVWENGKLWLSANTGCTPVGDTALRSCARVIEISTATRSVNWDTDLGEPGAHLFFPAIRPDASGNLVIVYGESGVALLPQLVALGRAPDGSLTTPIVVAQSVGQHEGGRYGDYFGAARDPAHPELVWVAGEQGIDVQGARGWSTVVAAAQVTSAGVTPPVIRGAAPPGVKARPVTGRVGAAIRLSYTALDDGAAVRQRLVVSAKNTVVFTVMTTPGRLNIGQGYYVLWHPARRLRGTFSWCVRTIAADGTRSPQSCSTVTLR